jgi:hypothetical protein
MLKKDLDNSARWCVCRKIMSFDNWTMVNCQNRISKKYSLTHTSWNESSSDDIVWKRVAHSYRGGQRWAVFLTKLLLLQQMPTATQNGNVSHMLSRRSIINKFRGNKQSWTMKTSELKSFLIYFRSLGWAGLEKMMMWALYVIVNLSSHLARVPMMCKTSGIINHS